MYLHFEDGFPAGAMPVVFSMTETIVIRSAWVLGLLGDHVGTGQNRGAGERHHGDWKWQGHVPWGQAVLYS